MDLRSPPPNDLKVESLVSLGITTKRMRYPADDLGKMPVIPTDDAFSVIVQLQPFERHRLWRNGRLVFEGGHPAGALAITDLRDVWQCHHMSSFDNLRMHIPFRRLHALADQLGYPGIDDLRCEAGAIDPVMFSLAHSLLPALENPATAHAGFVDQVHLAMVSHLLHTYGGRGRVERGKRLLSSWQEQQAKDYMRERYNRDLSMADVAAACNLSRSYFIRAFRETTGVTPHRWLLDHRIAKVKEMLLGDLPLAQIASENGFADQSHLSRGFSKAEGLSPSVWRKLHTQSG